MAPRSSPRLGGSGWARAAWGGHGGHTQGAGKWPHLGRQHLKETGRRPAPPSQSLWGVTEPYKHWSPSFELVPVKPSAELSPPPTPHIPMGRVGGSTKRSPNADFTPPAPPNPTAAPSPRVPAPFLGPLGASRRWERVGGRLAVLGAPPLRAGGCESSLCAPGTRPSPRDAGARETGCYGRVNAGGSLRALCAAGTHRAWLSQPRYQGDKRPSFLPKAQNRVFLFHRQNPPPPSTHTHTLPGLVLAVLWGHSRFGG